MLRRAPFLSRAIIWAIAGVTTFGVVWACVAKVDESVMATGKLAPQGSIKEVKAPLNGVVKEIHVEDGQRVKQGDLLLFLDSRTAQAQQTALQKVKAALSQENQLYRSVLQGDVAAIPTTVKVPPEIADLTKSRSALIAENRLYRSQLSGVAISNLNPDERLRLRSALSETASREATAQLEIEQLQQQLARTEAELAGARDIVVVNEEILRDIEAVAQEGALSRVQYLEQRQKVRSGQSEVEQLTKERSRLQLAINQAREKLENTQASQQDVLTKMAANDQKIAEIDTQLNKASVENEKQIAETENQLSQAQVTLQYQQLRALVDGAVFDLQVTAPGFVANSAESLLKMFQVTP